MSYREPGTVDQTEVERAKIHEAAETARKRIEEAEKTKRAIAAEKGDAWVVPWIAAAIAAVIGVIATASTVQVHIERTHHTPPEPCRDSSTLVSTKAGSPSSHECALGAQRTTEPAPNGMMVHCTCARQP